MLTMINSNPNIVSVNKNCFNILPWFQKVKNWLLPGSCVVCGTNVTSELDLCSSCEHELPWLENICVGCALPLPSNFTSQICGNCLQHPLPYSKTIALFSYDPPIDRLITGLKFQNKLVYGNVLGKLLIKHLFLHYTNETFPECIIPVPLHPNRLRERGYNQTVELVKPIAKKFKIRMDLKSCQRIRPTLAQTTLPASDRQANMKHAFSVNQKLMKMKHVAIFDDVITTGQTVIELSKTLLDAGVERVDVWCCARTGLPKK